MVMKKIFGGVFDEEVHSDFLKFGRGDYKDRYLLEGKKQGGGKWAIKAGPEFANFLVKKCLGKVSGKVGVKGIIVSTMDLSKEVSFSIKKSSNFQGVRKVQIETEVEASEVFRLMEKYPRVFFALSFSGSSFDLKIKAKAPKSGKPGKESEEGPVADFCSLKTEDKSIVEELFFDVSDFKEISINHLIKVEGIVYPKEMAKMRPEEVREQSKRKGVVIRKAVIDGKEKISQANFVA
jgi:hypothetical protein